MTKRTKMIVGLVSLIVVGGIGVGAAKSRNEKPVEVRLESVQERDLVAIVSASGWIRPHRKVDVQADIMGRIVALNVREGEEVTRGQVLMRIDPTQYQAAVARAEYVEDAAGVAVLAVMQDVGLLEDDSLALCHRGSPFTPCRVAPARARRRPSPRAP